MTDAILVIPCYNEASRLPVQDFESFACKHPNLRFIFVNDGSTDGTAQVVDSLARSRPQSFAVLNLHKNQGKAEAVRQGMLKALESSPKFVGFWDADLATPLEEIPLFVEVLNEQSQTDWVFGSRVNMLGRSVKRNLLRHYVGRVFATATCAVLRMAVYDTQCGAKLFRADATLRQILADPFRTNWIFDVELIARLFAAHRDGKARAPKEIIYELPLRTWQDVRGSKVKVTDFFRAAVELWRIRRTYMRQRRPKPTRITRMTPARSNVF